MSDLVHSYAFGGPAVSFDEEGVSLTSQGNLLQYQRCGFDVLIESPLNVSYGPFEYDSFPGSDTDRLLAFLSSGKAEPEKGEKLDLKLIVRDPTILSLSSVRLSLCAEPGSPKKPIAFQSEAGEWHYPDRNAEVYEPTMTMIYHDEQNRRVDEKARRIIYQFADEEELFRLLLWLMRPYAVKKAYAGLCLKDAPRADSFTAIRQIRQAVGKVDSFFGTHTSFAELMPRASSLENAAAFGLYLSVYQKETGDYQSASLPFFVLRQGKIEEDGKKIFEGNYISPTCLNNYQAIAQIDAQKGTGWRLCLQSFGSDHGFRSCGERGLRWQITMGLAFGAKRFSYFCYCLDGAPSSVQSAIVNYTYEEGHRESAEYVAVKKLNEELSLFVPKLAGYRYRSANVFVQAPGGGARSLPEQGYDFLPFHAEEPGIDAVMSSTASVLFTRLAKGDSTCLAVVNLEDPSRGRRNQVIFLLKQEIAVCLGLGSSPLCTRKDEIVSLSLKPGEGAFLFLR